MEFGMPTLMEFHSLAENCALAQRLGLHFVELNMNLPYCTVEALSRADLNALARQYDIYFTLHADENLFFCDFNNRIASAHLATMLDAIALCNACNIPLINFHMSPGVYFTLPDGKYYLFNEYKEQYFQRLMLFRNTCEKAAGNQTALCIENTGLTQGFILEGMEALLASPAFHLTWDIGHDFSAGNADQPFILSHLQRVVHMHIHGASGKKNHLSLTDGELDWRARLSLACPRRAVIEVKTAQFLAQSVEALASFTGGD